MRDAKKVTPAALQKRWLRDFTAQRQTYVPESEAAPSRACEGFELKRDGTYRRITSGPDDRTVESEGTWDLDDAGTLTLSPTEMSGVTRKLHVIEANEDRLIVEE